jgi:uncharacterized protein (TIGR02996 family)
MMGDHMEQAFIEAINANPKDRAPQLIYADWLCEEAGEDALAEGWRVLVQAGRMPSCWAVRWRWMQDWLRSPPHALPSAICNRMTARPDALMCEVRSYPHFFSAFTDAAVAYVRYYHDPMYRVLPALVSRDYLRDNTQAELANRRAKQSQWEMLPYDPIPRVRSTDAILDGASAVTGRYEPPVDHLAEHEARATATRVAHFGPEFF